MLVFHQSNVVEIPAGNSVRSIRRSLGVPLNLSSKSYPIVNGRKVDDDFRTTDVDRLDFLDADGVKLGDAVAWTGDQFCQFFQVTQEDLDAWISQGLKVGRCLDGSLRITSTAANDFFRGKVIESPYLTVEEAAVYARTTVSNIYGLIERRKLKSMPGTRSLLFTKEMLDAYLKGE